jgi:hypothetical protein
MIRDRNLIRLVWIGLGLYMIAATVCLIYGISCLIK